MFTFWLSATLLIIIALACVLTPLLLVKPKIHVGVDESIKNVPTDYLLAVFLIVCIPTFSISLYKHYGNNEAVKQWLQSKNNAEKIKQEVARLGSRQQIILTLREKLQQLPLTEKNAKGWFILGKLYYNEKQYQEALQAFRQAMQLKPNDNQYLEQFVTVHFFINQQLDNDDNKIITKLLKKNPNNINMLNLLALNAYQNRNYSEAIHYWEKLLPYFQPESEDSNNLLQMIRQAQLSQSQVSEKQIKVSIDVASYIKNNLTHNEKLYVYALDANGSNIPLAVLRLDRYNFPAQITLDSSQSMMPGHSLANANKIVVKARLSKSGQALSSPGDLMGVSKVVDLHSMKSAAVTIDKVVTD